MTVVVSSSQEPGSVAAGCRGGVAARVETPHARLPAEEPASHRGSGQRGTGARRGDVLALERGVHGNRRSAPIGGLRRIGARCGGRPEDRSGFDPPRCHALRCRAPRLAVAPHAERRLGQSSQCGSRRISGQLVRARSPGPPDLACETLPCQANLYWMILDQLSLDALRGSRPGTIGEADEKAHA